MPTAGANPFRATVIWLTPEQGGRSSGPPIPRTGLLYAVTEFVPPFTSKTGLASFVLSGFEPGAWQSQATGRWLIAPNQGPQTVRPGSVVVVTEGGRHVAYFHVEEVGGSEPDDTAASA